MNPFGLRAYAQNFLKPYELKSTPVIIDGNISVKFGSENSGDSRLGGDYRKIYDAVYEFFHQLQECNIIPIVVKRGRYKDDEFLKIQKYRKQAMSIALNYKENGYNFDDIPFPTFASHVFYAALKDLGIIHCSNESEVSDDILELAKKTKYPLISDKYGYGLCEGVILILWETIKEKNPTESHVQCSVFDRESFSNGIPSSILPFLMVIFSSAPWHRKIFEKILPEFKNKKNVKERYRLILDWMRTNEKNICEAKMNEALRKTSKNPKKINYLLKHIFEPTISVLPTLMKNEEITPYLENFKFNELDIDNGVPADIATLVKECRLPGPTLDMYTHREYRCKVNPVEDIDKDSIHTPAVRIIQGIYGLLIKDLEEKRPMVVNIKREGLEDKKLAKMALNIPGGALSDSEKYEIVYLILNLKSNEKIKRENKTFFDDDWYIFILAFTFWKKQCADKINKKHIESTILTTYLLHLLIKDKNKIGEGELSKSFAYLTNDRYASALEKVETFITEREDRVALTDISHIHMYLTFQSCLYYMIQVFTLLGLPDKIKISDFLCGSYYHSIFTQLKEVEESTGSVENWFNDCENLRELYDTLNEELK